MTGSRNYAIGAAVLSAVATICLFGCTHFEPSTLEAPGVRRITPSGPDWSHVSGISWSSDGTELALTWVFGGSDLRPEGYIYTVDVEGINPRILNHTEADGAFLSPAWSPTANQIAFYSDAWDPSGIWLVDTEDQEAPTFLGEGFDCAWAPDGEEIAIANSAGTDYTIYILNIRTGEQRQAFQLSEEGKYVSGWGISWSPTGNQLAFSVDRDDHDSSTPSEMDIYVLNLVSGECRQLTESGYNWFPSWSPDGTMLAFSGEKWSRQTLVIMRVDNGSIVKPLDAVGVGPVAWSPDGDSIAFEWRDSVYAVDTAAALGE